MASQSINLEKGSAPERVLTELYGVLSEEYDSRLPVPMHHAAARN